MSIKYYANKVQETSTTNGPGNLVLGGSTTGYRNFVSALGTNKKFTYYIYRLDTNLEWEIGVGHILSSGGVNQLVRENVLSSTNLNTFVSFGGGTKYIEPIISEDRVNTSFINVDSKSGNFTADHASATYLIDSSSGNVQINLPAISSQDDSVILSFYLKNTIGSQYEQNNAIYIVPSGLETVDGSSSLSVNIIKDYIQIVSVPSEGKWHKLDPIQDATYPYGNDGSVQLKNNSAFSGTPSLSWNFNNKALLIGGTGNIVGADIILPASGQTVVFNEQSLDKDLRIEGSNNTHLLFIDAGSNQIGINTSLVKDSLTIDSKYGKGITVHTSGSGPQITIGNTSVSGLASNSTIGSIAFSGLNSTNSPVIYSKIYSVIDSTINGSENSSIAMEVLNNGSSEDVFVISSSGINLGFNNQNNNGIIVGGVSSNEGNNIVLGYYNNICGENCVALGNDIQSSGLFGGILGYDHAVSGNNIWILGGSGVSVSGNNKTYLAVNNNNHLSIINSSGLAYTTLTSNDVNFSINNKAILSSGIKESIVFNFTNSSAVSKTGLTIGSNISSVSSGNENANLYAKSIYNGSLVDILNVSAVNINLGNNTSSGSSIVCGSNNISSNSGNILYGTTIVSSGNNNILIGSNINCSGNNITAFGKNLECGPSGNLGIVIFGNNNTANEDYAVSIGNNNSSSGLYSVACGYNNGSHGDYSVGVGSNNTVLSNSSVAVGRNNNLNGLDLYSTIFAVGIGNYASIYNSGILVGYNNELRGNGGLIVGNNSSVSGTNSVVIGNGVNFSGNDTTYLNNKYVQLVSSSGVNILVQNSGISISSSGTNINNQLTVNTIPVSISGHTHTSSNITNFNSSVSGLLPTIANSGNNRILTSDGTSYGINAESNLTFDGSHLSVNGSGNFSNGLYVNNTLAVSGVSGIYYFNTPTFVGPSNTLYIENNKIVMSSSSIKTKENIKPYTKGLSDVLKLNPVLFNYIGGTQTTAGLIAEEIHTNNLDEFVVMNNNEPIDITYGQMIVLLINAIKELNAEIIQLKNL